MKLIRDSKYGCSRAPIAAVRWLLAACLMASTSACQTTTSQLAQDAPDVAVEAIASQRSGDETTRPGDLTSAPQSYPVADRGAAAQLSDEVSAPESAIAQVGYEESFYPQSSYPSLPPQAWTGEPQPPVAVETIPPGHPALRAPWSPPAIACPWPQDEYLCDGGDSDLPVEVGKDWSVYGLNQEDTVVHYDTLDGHTLVQPSNRVCIYAPRFAAVRKVYGIVLRDQVQRIAGVDAPAGLIEQDDIGVATTVLQPVQPDSEQAAKGAELFLDRMRNRGVDNRQRLIENYERRLPHEDLNIARDGLIDATEKARLAAAQAAAKAWTRPEGVSVAIEEQRAVERIRDTAAGETHRYELPDGKKRLCIVKMASKQNALPGDEVEFTLRFDNVGEQKVGNVTIIDNLTTRLEYIEGSAQCSLAHEFFATENEGESLILRWEITEPMQVGDGGVITFKCRVR